ncbi:MAG: putative surface layer protein [Bacillota bacterium]|nr:putative surface layer protein [Bacillota bacterium]
MVVTDVADNKFEPNRRTTRAEFAAIIIRALGLKPGTGMSSFKDVRVSDWYFESIQTAVSYGIIKGYNEETFAPNTTITREQAMTTVSQNALRQVWHLAEATIPLRQKLMLHVQR